MNLITFLKLIYRHIIILMIAPVILAVVVYYLTRNEVKIFQSKTTIYTGIASGYNLETEGSNVGYFGTSNAFDNLINIIDSRETQEEVGMALLAIHLSLDAPNPKYINKQNFNNLQNIIPEDLRLLVDQLKNGNESTEKVINKENDDLNIDSIIEARKTTQTPKKVTKFHFVKKDETLYSIARKYNISVEKLMEINNLSGNNIKVDDRLIIVFEDDNTGNQERGSIDIDTNRYYILKVDQDIEDIAKKFDVPSKLLITWNGLTDRIIPKGTKIIVGNKYRPNAYKRNKPKNDTFNYIIDIKQEFFNKNKSHSGLSDEQLDLINRIYNTITIYKNKSDSNFIYELLHYHHPIYSIRAISKTKVKRISNSDLVELSYSSSDPGICQLTLLILIDVFIDNYKLIKENQTDAVVKYFQKQVNVANQRLQMAEDKLLEFNKKNSIINYYEQTKFIAEEKEDLDVTFQDEKMTRASASAALKKIEDRLNIRGQINLATTEILKKRKELSEVVKQIALVEAYSDGDSTAWELVYLNKKSDKIKDELELLLEELYGFNNSVRGMPIDNLLREWLDKVIAYEESNARLAVLDERKEEFIAKYELMAPLGAILKRIEREIDVAEREYLSLLHSLNMAKLKQQNVEFSSNIKPVDLPYFPLIPRESKRKMLIIAAALAGFMIILAIIVILEYFDSTLKNAERAEKQIGLTAASVFPRLPAKHGKIHYPFIISRVTEMLIQKIQLTVKNKKPVLIAIFSTRDEEGKSFIAERLNEKLNNLGHSSQFHEITTNENKHTDYITDPDLYAKTHEIKDLIPDHIKASFNDHQFIIIELPSLLKNNYHPDLIQTFDCSFLVTRANRTWSTADQKALASFKELSKEVPSFILNVAKLEALESLIGEIPRQRSIVRKIIKRIVSFQLYNKINI